VFVGSEKECEDYIKENTNDPAVSARGGFKLVKTAKVPMTKEIEESLKESDNYKYKSSFSLGMENNKILKNLLRKAKATTKTSIKVEDMDTDIDPMDNEEDDGLIGTILVTFYTKNGAIATNELIANLAKVVDADGDLEYSV
jgi:hypothetical protein